LFGLTEASIRLDLAQMEQAGLVRRYRGGARLLPPSPFVSRQDHQREAKQAIARQALTHVQRGETLYLDSGSTVLCLARLLTCAEDLTVVTNSIPVFTYLGREPDKKVIVVGGEFSSEDQCCFGQVTERQLSNIYVSKVFMGADAIDVESGLVFSHPRNLDSIETIIRNARQTFLLADSTKFTRIQGMKIVDLSGISMIVTDSGLAPGLRDSITRRGVALEIAG
jgi:DeoR/GlpR family transcriptional regulator of sugar metabolism